MNEIPDSQQETPPSYFVNSKDWEELFDREKSHIQSEQSSKDTPLSGFAVSGGGIRSASFGLGVMQAFVARNMLTAFDYLSTVSGGGYLGSSLTWYLEKGAPGIDKTDCTPEGFPFGAKRVGAQSPANSTTEEQDRPNRNAVLNYIRQHGNYLTPGKGLNGLSLAAPAIRSMFLSLAIIQALLAGIMILGYQFLKLVSSGGEWYVYSQQLSVSVFGWTESLFGFTVLDFFSPSSALLDLSLIGLVLFAFANLFYSLGSWILYKWKHFRLFNVYSLFIGSQKRIALLWSIIIGLAVVGSVPYSVNLIKGLSWGMIGTGSIMGYLQYLNKQQGEDAGGLFSDLKTYLAVILVLYGLLLSAYYLGVGVLDADAATGGWLIAGSLVFGFLTNANVIGHHRMYRDRLMELFMPNRKAIIQNQWEPATEANNAMLHEFCQKNPRPYHLINTNVILKDSDNPVYRGRGGDNFILSPLFCGSFATGWRSTESYQFSKSFDGVSLATAMAASGAALNPHAGVSSGGITRNSLVSLLLSVLNLRLGVHLPRPSEYNWTLMGFIFRSNLIYAIGASLFGAQNEKEPVVEISDGGHFENLGMYELVRRKLSLIVVSDGGADPGYNFDDLTNAIEKIRVDFGVDIVFDDNALENLIPEEREGSSLDQKCAIADKGFARAAIHYPDGKKGVLIYLKTTMIPDLPVDVLGYKMANPDFPDQSTGDQFFDEKQFEAYRELGYRIGRQFLESTGRLLTDEESDSPSPMVDRIKSYLGKVES